MDETAAENIVVPGQGVLPGFQELLRIESSRLKKPKQEAFCWEFVTNGGEPGPAYQATIKSNVTPLRAQKNASALLKKSEIAGRIQEISGIIQRKYENEVIAARIRDLRRDPSTYFKEDGTAKRIHEMPVHERRGIGLEAKLVEGVLKYIPVFPLPEKAADALQKMFGMNKVEIEGDIGLRHSGTISVSEDIQKMDALREKFGLPNGEADTTA